MLIGKNATKELFENCAPTEIEIVLLAELTVKSSDLMIELSPDVFLNNKVGPIKDPLTLPLNPANDLLPSRV